MVSLRIVDNRPFPGCHRDEWTTHEIVRKPRSGNFIATRTDQELADLQETRLLIEGYAARVVCETFDEAKERQLSQIVTSMSDVEGTSDWLTGSRLNARFHQTVVNLTANGSLLHLWKTLDSLTWLLAPWASPIDTRVQSDLVRRHQALIDALASGDPERAAGDFAEHILRATPIAGGHHSRLPLVLAAATTTR